VSVEVWWRAHSRALLPLPEDQRPSQPSTHSLVPNAVGRLRFSQSLKCHR
jgi:hypothetical protein